MPQFIQLSTRNSAYVAKKLLYYSNLRTRYYSTVKTDVILRLWHLKTGGGADEHDYSAKSNEQYRVWSAFMNVDNGIPADRINDDALVLRDDKDGVATLTLNRASKFNALSGDLMAELERNLAKIADDVSIRVVILAAHGKAFCAGHDLKELGAKETRADVDSLFRQCTQLMLAVTNLPQPVIAKVDGIATAAGCQLVATCDLAVASSNSRFATSGINVGLFCATPGVALSRNVPRKKAMEMLLTGDFIDSDVALQFGLINQVVERDDLDKAVGELAMKITRHSPKAITMGKSLFYQQINEGLESAYGRAVDTIVDNMIEGEARAGIEAFVAKQPMPDWEDR